MKITIEGSSNEIKKLFNVNKVNAKQLMKFDVNKGIKEHISSSSSSKHHRN